MNFNVNIENEVKLNDSENYTEFEDFKEKILDDKLSDKLLFKSMAKLYNKEILKGSIKVNYFEMYTGKQISSQDIYTDLELGEYSYNSKEISGYSVIGENKKSIGLTNEELNKSINFQYVSNENLSSISFEEVPYISTYYFNTKPSINEDVIIKYYVTDYNQSEYLEDKDRQLEVQCEVDGKRISSDIVNSGDNEMNLGKLSEGVHYFSLQASDKDTGLTSNKLYNEIMVINPDSYVITEEQTYYINDSDLQKYGIKSNNSTIEEDMINTRNGLTKLFSELQNKGYRKCILPVGIYRVKCTSRTECIYIPTNFTVDMNGSTFKLNTVLDNNVGIAIVRMENTVDSHLINGILEGDRFERKALGLERSYNGEPINTLYLVGGKYCSIENLKIKATTGHTIMSMVKGISNAGKLNEFSNKLIYNGEEIYGVNWYTSEIKDITNLLSSKYIMVGTDGGYRGVKGKSLVVYFNFYDENKKFLQTEVGYQYRKTRIPEKSKYVAVSFYGEVTANSNISLFYRELGTNWSYKNISFEDTRTTAIATTSCDDLLIEDCTFTRCGNSITPSAVDFEDGWQECQDVYFRNCTLLESGAGNTVIDNTGYNHVYENNTGFIYLIRYSVVGLVLRDSKKVSVFRWVRGYNTGSQYSRVYDNEFGSVYSPSDDNDEGIVSTIIKDSTINGGVETSTKTFAFKNCKGLSISGSRAKFINCDIYPKPYLGNDFIFENCNFYNMDDKKSEIRFSFNYSNATRIFNNCTFKSTTNLDSHNYFNTGIFNKCTFEEDVKVNPNVENNLGELQFDNCTFNKNITLNIKNENCYIEFEHCTFRGTISYIKYGEKNSIFRNTVNNDENTNKNYFENLDFRSVNEGKVIVTRNSGNSITFAQQSRQQYVKSDLFILPSGKYNLNINIIHDSGEITAPYIKWDKSDGNELKGVTAYFTKDENGIINSRYVGIIDLSNDTEVYLLVRIIAEGSATKTFTNMILENI